MDILLQANDYDDMMRLMQEVTVETPFPGVNPRILAAMAMVARFPGDLGIRDGSRVLSMARAGLASLTPDTYDHFEVAFTEWRARDLDEMIGEIGQAREVVNDTLASSPPDREWYGDWQRGSELQLGLLDQAQTFLERQRRKIGPRRTE